MFGSGHTYFADAPVVIDISGLQWPAASPFNIVRVEVVYDNKVVGDFRADTGRQTSISFDISSALRSIWSDYDFMGTSNSPNEVRKAIAALSGDTEKGHSRTMRQYSLRVYTEYLASDGVFTPTYSGEFAGGQCMIGGLTEWERSVIPTKESADASYWNGTNLRFGDASTKPVSTAERVGRDSMTSWVDVNENVTTSIYYPAAYNHGSGEGDSAEAHAPLVLRDSIPYTDFLFVNRRGAVETCSALMLENMNIEVKTEQYSRVERPSFAPSRSQIAISSGGRRSWNMSSGHLTRDWAEWWAMEFLKARQWWMLYKGAGMTAASYVPVTVEPAKKSTGIFDHAKQQMPSVEFTVTMALEGC